MSSRPDSSPFRKLVLIPLWVIRDIVMVVNIAVLALIIFAFAYVDRRPEKQDSLGNAWKSLKNEGVSAKTVIAVCAVNMAIIMLCLTLDLVSLVKRIRHTLSPKFFLVTNSIQTLIWTVFFVLSMIGTRAAGPIVVAVVIYLTFIGMLIYGIIVYRRERRNPPILQNKMMEYEPQQHVGGHP